MKWTPMRLVAVSAAAGAVLVATGGGTTMALTSHTAPAAATAPAQAPARTAPAKAAPAKTTAPAAPASAVQTPTAQAPAVTIINEPPAAGSAVYVPVPSYNVPSYVSASQQAVQQYYDDLNSQNYPAAWALGGSSLNGGTGYSSWVAGYATTVPGGISLSTWSYDPDSNAVQVTISAEQTDGSYNTYQGSYTVASGVITGASIVQTS